MDIITEAKKNSQEMESLIRNKMLKFFKMRNQYGSIVNLNMQIRNAEEMTKGTYRLDEAKDFNSKHTDEKISYYVSTDGGKSKPFFFYYLIKILEEEDKIMTSISDTTSRATFEILSSDVDGLEEQRANEERLYEEMLKVQRQEQVATFKLKNTQSSAKM